MLTGAEPPSSGPSPLPFLYSSARSKAPLPPLDSFAEGCGGGRGGDGGGGGLTGSVVLASSGGGGDEEDDAARGCRRDLRLEAGRPVPASAAAASSGRGSFAVSHHVLHHRQLLRTAWTGGCHGRGGGDEAEVVACFFPAAGEEGIRVLTVGRC